MCVCVSARVCVERNYFYFFILPSLIGIIFSWPCNVKTWPRAGLLRYTTILTVIMSSLPMLGFIDSATDTF